MPPRWMMDPDFEENGYEYFNPDEDIYISNYYMHNCDDPFIYINEYYCNNVLYYLNGTGDEISDIENVEDDEDDE